MDIHYEHRRLIPHCEKCGGELKEVDEPIKSIMVRVLKCEKCKITIELQHEEEQPNAKNG